MSCDSKSAWLLQKVGGGFFSLVYVHDVNVNETFILGNCPVFQSCDESGIV